MTFREGFLEHNENVCLRLSSRAQRAFAGCRAARFHLFPSGRGRRVRRRSSSGYSSDGNAAALVLFLFDLLHLDGEDLCARPQIERKAKLAAYRPVVKQDYCVPTGAIGRVANDKIASDPALRHHALDRRGTDPRLVPVSRDGCRRGPVQRSWRKDGHYHGSDQSCPFWVKSGCPLDLDWWHQQHHAVPARDPDGEPWRAARSRSGEPGRGRFS